MRKSLMNENHTRWSEYVETLFGVVYPDLDGVSDSKCSRDFSLSRMILANYQGVDAEKSCDALERQWDCECEIAEQPQRKGQESRAERKH